MIQSHSNTGPLNLQTTTSGMNQMWIVENHLVLNGGETKFEEIDSRRQPG